MLFNTKDPQHQVLLMNCLDMVSAEDNCKPQFRENLRNWGRNPNVFIPSVSFGTLRKEYPVCRFIFFPQLSLDPPRMGRPSEFWENKSLLQAGCVGLSEEMTSGRNVIRGS